MSLHIGVDSPSYSEPRFNNTHAIVLITILLLMVITTSTIEMMKDVKTNKGEQVLSGTSGLKLGRCTL